MKQIFFLLFIVGNVGSMAQKADSLIFRLLCNYKLKQYEFIIQQEDDILQQKEDFVYPYLADAFLQSGNFEKAEEWYKKCEIKSTSISYYGLAICYARQGKYSYSLENLKKYLALKDKKWISEIKLDPDLKNLSHLEEWRLLWRTEYYTKWESQLADANYEYLQQRPINAIALVDKLIESRPKMDEALALKAEIYNSIENTKEAITQISYAIKLNKRKSEYYYKRSQYLQKEYDYKSALLDLDQAIKLDPYKIEYYIPRPELLFLSGQSQKALEEGLYLLQMDFVSDQLFLTIAKAYQKLNLPLKSMEILGKAITKFPYTGQLYYERGQLFFDSRAFTYAIKDLSMAMDFDPCNPLLYHKRGICRVEIGDLNGACRDFFKAREFGLTSADKEIRKYCLDKIDKTK